MDSAYLDELIRKACDFTDVLQLADADAIEAPRNNEKSDHRRASSSVTRFREASRDDLHQIVMHTATVPSSPIQLMRASAVMPCWPAEFLRYLDMDVRSLWDDHFIEGVVVQELLRKKSESPTPSASSSTALRTGGSSSHSSTSSPSRIDVSPSSSSTTTTTKIQLKHVGFLSPIPVLLNRDFELVVAEELRADGTAILKAFSPKIGSVTPVRSDYVRGLVAISGFVAVPLRYSEPRLGREVDGCRVTYIALIHPMGLIPAFLVNAVVGKQTSGLLQLQEYIAKHPLSALQANGVIDAAHSGGSAAVGVVMRRRHHRSAANSKL